VIGDPLARPVWSALTGPQSALALRHGQAVRIDPEIGFFAATGEPGVASKDLAEITRSVARASWLLEEVPIACRPGLVLRRTARLTQMIAIKPELTPDIEGIVALGEEAAAEMFALAHATEPGPWESRTHRYGGYYGIHEHGRLVAMAGTRLRPAANLAEVSGVCTYPEARGRGHARRLMIRVMRDMAERGETPFLHCWSSNTAAIALYRTLGFEISRELSVSIVEAE
jgi:ribosomal protein S18 acetylase RimI-like enzyme